MHIVSWNIAGLSTTLQRIDSDYGTRSSCQWEKGLEDPQTNSAVASAVVAPSASRSFSKQPPGGSNTSKPPRCHAFSYYLQRHAIDILCLQEHKIPYKQLSSRSEPMGCSSVPGYESFWSCCTNRTCKGMNGVVTFAKIGTVRSADPAPLQDEELDSQGRCIRTDHGGFIIFNVYVPQGGSCGVAFKLKFLQRLHQKIQECRTEYEKPVILVGDLNIAHQSIDVFWNRRKVNIKKVVEDMQYHKNTDKIIPTVNTIASTTDQNWMLDISKYWSEIVSVLATKTAVKRQTTNPTTGEKFDKYCVVVTLAKDNNRMITLGKAEASKEEALLRYDLSACTYDDEETEKSDGSNCVMISLDLLTELMSKVCGVEWTMTTQRLIASSDYYLYHESPTITWLRGLIDNDQMIDAFRFFYPHEQGRFTCWNQYTNKRFVNDGNRIDYTLVDKELEPFLRKGAQLRGVCGENDNDPYSDKAALNAVTANGGYKAASFDGSGIANASQDALDSQFGQVHSGMIYTPPSYSDHIAVSLLLDDTLVEAFVQLDETDRPTRKAQPHKMQSSIKSFFSGDCNKKTSDSKTQLPIVRSLRDTSQVLKSTTKATYKEEKTTKTKILKRENELKQTNQVGINRKIQRTETITTAYRWFQPKSPKNGAQTDT